MYIYIYNLLFGIFHLLGIIISNLICYFSICTDAELFISLYLYICIHMTKYLKNGQRYDVIVYDVTLSYL